MTAFGVVVRIEQVLTPIAVGVFPPIPQSSKREQVPTGYFKAVPDSQQKRQVALLIDQLLKALTLKKLHDDVWIAFMLPHVVYRHYVGVMKGFQ